MGRRYPHTTKAAPRPLKPPSDAEIALLLGLAEWHSSGTHWCAPASVGGDRRNGVSSKLRRLVSLGLIEMQARDGLSYAPIRQHCLYRLTPAGHAFCAGPEAQRVAMAARAATATTAGEVHA